MNGTGTGAVELRDVPVGADDVLSADLPGFMGRCVPAMLLLQTGLAVGLTDAALPAAAEHLSGPDAGFRAEHEALSGRHSAVAARLGDLAARPAVSRRPELARLRLDALHLAADVVRLEGVVAGGTGFRAESPTSRRRREVAFLPVQAPTEGQLRAMAATG
jgi:alkylation response protein AidB-like acyl-CoA dehydrogenase